MRDLKHVNVAVDRTNLTAGLVSLATGAFIIGYLCATSAVKQDEELKRESALNSCLIQASTFDASTGGVMRDACIKVYVGG